jgi:Protein of unknown function (DUF3224)
MKLRVRAATGVTTAICICVGIGAFEFVAHAGAHSAIRSTLHNEIRNKRASKDSQSTATQKEAPVATQHASGPFDVKLVAQGAPDKAEGSTLARMSIDKQYHGGLEGTAKGEMLTAGTDVQGSAGYVAIERVIGTLNGRSGSFVLQHSGTLTRGAPVQSITVVPDSGSGQLAGITGKLTVIIEGGKHSYEFEYTLPPAQ